MAKVVIRGDSSGEVTLNVPAVAGSSTLTIPDANGSILTDNTTITVAQGGTGTSSFTAYGVVCGGTDSTSALQSISPGTSGQVLASGGAGALPSFQSISSLVTEITVTQITTAGAGTWAVPSTGTYALVRAWGGGGSGGRGGGTTTRGSGGGGGGYAERTYKLSDLGTPGTNISYVVGAGGAAKATAGVGNAGANTTFSSGATGLTAYAGGAGFGNATTNGGGGGGGALGSGGNGTNAAGGTGGSMGGGTGGTSADANPADLPWGGAGGGGTSTTTPNAGGNAFLGGGGGGCASGGTTSGGTAGTSVFGGNGGASSATSGTPGSPGAQPGGGGGGQGANGGSSGKGGDGQLEIWVW